MSRAKRYWAYRIDTDSIDYFGSELIEHGRLRQGWGWDKAQDLRKRDDPDFLDGGASGNIRIFTDVKKGDVLLVPRLPDWDSVAIVEAERDFDAGYVFDIDADAGDYGHQFPATFVGSFLRKSVVVEGDIRTTLRNPLRFWSLDAYAGSIDQLLKATEEKRNEITGPVSRLGNALDKAMQNVGDTLWKELCRTVEGKEWECVLEAVLQRMYPTCIVEQVGGRSEAGHGTDLLVTFPAFVGDTAEYAIAIQVKDQTEVTDDAKSQIDRAPAYWKKERGFAYVSKYLFVTKAADRLESSQDDKTRVLVANDLKDTLGQYAALGLDPEI